MERCVDYECCGTRIKSCALEFISARYDRADKEEQQESLWIMEKDVELKSTFMYCDFCRMIKAAPTHEKEHLSSLASNLLSSFQQLGNAVKLRSFSLACKRYKETCNILEDVVASMPPSISERIGESYWDDDEDLDEYEYEDAEDQMGHYSSIYPSVPRPIPRLLPKSS